MRAFAGLATTTATLTRGDVSVSYEMTALPFGFVDLLDEVMPAPKPPINGPVPPAEQARWATRRVMIMLAKSLGSALEAVAPDGKAGAAAWHAYADAIRAEFIAANLVDGDLQTLLDVMTRLNKGGGDLPKA